jgi:hypothetical protein
MPRHDSALRTALPVVAALLTGCSHLPVTSLPRLNRIDPAVTDFAAVRVALATPAALQPEAGGVRLILTRRIGATAEDRATFALAEVPVSADLAALHADAGGILHVYALAPDDAARMGRLRDELLRARAAGETATASFSVASEGYCRRGARLPERLPISTYLRTAETGDFVPLVVGFDLATQPGVIEALRTRPVCPGTTAG